MANEKLPPVPPRKPLLQEKEAVLKPTTTESYKLAGPTPPSAGVIPAALKEPRLAGLDAFRGFIMLAMVSAGLRLKEVLEQFDKFGKPHDSREYQAVAWLQDKLDHVVWQGGVFWDLIQPAFMFMVGVALPFSNARRAARGDSYAERLWHTLVRSVILVALGVFLANPAGNPARNLSITQFTFANVLAQIGLGYLFVFLLCNRGLWVQLGAIAAICVGYWFAFYQHPVPPPDFDYMTVGIPETIKSKTGERVPNPDRQKAVLQGHQAHWTKNTNFAAEVDRKFLNLFPINPDPPREKGETDEDYALRKRNPFRFNEGGYATLNFVPSIITMLLGLVIGELLRSNRSRAFKLQWLLLGGAICLALGLGAGYTICPIIKRIWTPSWALASGGVVIWMLMLFYLVIDCTGQRWLAWPLAVVGMNSIVVYMMSQMLKGWTLGALNTHLTVPWAKFAAFATERTGTPWDPHFLGKGSSPYFPMYEALAVMVVFWLVCVWLWRQKLFVRI